MESLRRPCAFHDTWWRGRMEPEAWAAALGQMLWTHQLGAEFVCGRGDEPSSALGSDEVAQLEKLFLA